MWIRTPMKWKIYNEAESALAITEIEGKLSSRPRKAAEFFYNFTHMWHVGGAEQIFSRESIKKD